MEQKQQNEKMNLQDTHMCTPLAESEMCEKNLNKELYSDPDTEPFRTINVEGKWIIALGNNRVSEKEFECEFDALEYIGSKPWDLILIGANVYRDICKEIKKSTEKIKSNGNN